MPSLNCEQSIFDFFRSTDLVPLLLAYIIGTNLSLLNGTVTKHVVNPIVSFVFNSNRIEHNYILLRKGSKAPYNTLEDAFADQDAIVLGYGFVLSEFLSLFIIIVSIFLIFKLICSLSKLKALMRKNK